MANFDTAVHNKKALAGVRRVHRVRIGNRIGNRGYRRTEADPERAGVSRSLLQRGLLLDKLLVIQLVRSKEISLEILQCLQSLRDPMSKKRVWTPTKMGNLWIRR